MKRWIVIDVGCHECGVNSEVVGSYATENEARLAAEERSEETEEWRDGQSIPQVFEIEV